MKPSLTVTLLGTGTSQGVPIIGCSCEVCTSDDPHDSRLRTSALIASETTTLVIDTGPDFRQQMLREQVERLDAVLLTHEHNDHIIGIDDVRPYNFAQAEDMQLYGLERVLTDLRDRFRYAFEGTYPGAPRLATCAIAPWQTFRVGDIEVTPLPVEHGRLDILGYQLGADVVYITDASVLSDRVMDTIRGKDLIILNALHHRQHHSHFTLAEAVEVLEDLQPRQAYITHISHYMGLSTTVNADLPAFIRLGYDGQQIVVSGST